MTETVELIRIPNPPLPIVRQPESYDIFRGNHTPLVIDNGSTNLRFGFATSKSPVSVPNVVAKFKDRKQNKPLLLFGDAVDVESGARSQARTPWEGDVLLNFDALVSDRAPRLRCVAAGQGGGSFPSVLVLSDINSSPISSTSLQFFICLVSVSDNRITSDRSGT